MLSSIDHWVIEVDGQGLAMYTCVVLEQKREIDWKEVGAYVVELSY